MLLLVTDTSGKDGSIALARCPPEGSCTVLEEIPLAGGTFSAQLVPQVAALLARHGFDKRAIDGFAVVSGPGSFTGLRVGLAAIKALAEVLAKPVAAVSLLEAVATSGHSQGKILAALDAGRGEVYAGEYEVEERASMLSERLVGAEEFLALARERRLITPDASVAAMARKAGVEAQEIERPRTATIARLGWQRILAGETVGPEQLEANYIRRLDAEILSRPPAGKISPS